MNLIWRINIYEIKEIFLKERKPPMLKAFCALLLYTGLGHFWGVLTQSCSESCLVWWIHASMDLLHANSCSYEHNSVLHFSPVFPITGTIPLIPLCQLPWLHLWYNPRRILCLSCTKVCRCFGHSLSHSLSSSSFNVIHTFKTAGFLPHQAPTAFFPAGVQFFHVRSRYFLAL